MKPNIQLPKVRNTSWLAQEKNQKNRCQLGGGREEGGKKEKNLKALYGVCQWKAMKLRDCSLLCNTCKGEKNWKKGKKKKKKRHFHPLLNFKLPSFCLATSLGKCKRVKGPLSVPTRSLCRSATVNNSKNVASAKVNVFYGDIPSAWWSATVPSLWGLSGTCALLWRAASTHGGGSSTGPPSALAGVPVLLVPHEGPMVAQDVHRVLPVPTGAAVVLEAGLWHIKNSHYDLPEDCRWK